MSEGKGFCPRCRAWGMEPAELFEECERITRYRCPICSHVLYEPVVRVFIHPAGKS